jgi:hypothetical protein
MTTCKLKDEEGTILELLGYNYLWANLRQSSWPDRHVVVIAYKIAGVNAIQCRLHGMDQSTPLLQQNNREYYHMRISC